MKTTEEMIEVMQAHLRGEKIEYLRPGLPVAWGEAIEPMWDWCNADYRIAPKPELTQDTIPWDALDERWQKSARNADGDIILFTNSGRPAPGGGGWQTSGPWCVATGLIAVIPGTVDWRDSLQQRPAAGDERP